MLEMEVAVQSVLSNTPSYLDVITDYIHVMYVPLPNIRKNFELIEML